MSRRDAASRGDRLRARTQPLEKLAHGDVGGNRSDVAEDKAHLSAEVRPGREQGLVFGYIGTISSHVPMRELFEGWVLARRRSPLLAASRLDIYGYLDHSGIPND